MGVCVCRVMLYGEEEEVWRQACRRRCFACERERRRWEEPREGKGRVREKGSEWILLMRKEGGCVWFGRNKGGF